MLCNIERNYIDILRLWSDFLSFSFTYRIQKDGDDVSHVILDFFAFGISAHRQILLDATQLEIKKKKKQIS